MFSGNSVYNSVHFLKFDVSDRKALIPFNWLHPANGGSFRTTTKRIWHMDKIWHLKTKFWHLKTFFTWTTSSLCQCGNVGMPWTQQASLSLAVGNGHFPGSPWNSAIAWYPSTLRSFWKYDKWTSVLTAKTFKALSCHCKLTWGRHAGNTSCGLLFVLANS